MVWALLVLLGTAGVSCADLIIYEYGGTLSLDSGPDALGLDTGTFTLTFSLDEDAPPLATDTQSQFHTTEYAILSTELTLSGTGSDGSFSSLASSESLELTDTFSGGGTDSWLTLDEPQFSVSGSTLIYGRTFADFGDQNFFTGSPPTPLPVFDDGDVAFLTTVGSPQVSDGTSNYSVLSPTIGTTTAPIPEPATLLLVSFGLGVLGCGRKGSRVAPRTAV